MHIFRIIVWFICILLVLFMAYSCKSVNSSNNSSSEAGSVRHEKVENNVIHILDTIKIHTTDTLLRIEYDTTIVTQRDTIRIQLKDKNINTYIHTTDTIRTDTITKFVTKTEQAIITNPDWWRWLLGGVIFGIIIGIILLWVIRTKVLGK